MKKISGWLVFGMVTGVVLLLSYTSCSNSKMDSNTAVNEEELKNGSWVITYFWDKDREETDHFSGMEFTFENNGSLAAVGSSSSANGFWSTESDDSRVKLALFFAVAPFSELSEDWMMATTSSAKIELMHESGGDAGISRLTFDRK
jgi:hypothetical protein